MVAVVTVKMSIMPWNLLNTCLTGKSRHIVACTYRSVDQGQIDVVTGYHLVVDTID